MDAARLVAEAERKMRGCPQPEDVLAEAWQAYELTEALGAVLAHAARAEGERAEDEGARVPGRGSSGTGWPAGPGRPSGAGASAGPGRPQECVSGRRGSGPGSAAGSWTGPGSPAGAGSPAGVSTGAGPPRAARLTGVRDAPGTLRALRALLGEIGHALVGLTGSAEDETAYWQCIEALDAVDEAKDRVRALARDAPG